MDELHPRSPTHTSRSPTPWYLESTTMRPGSLRICMRLAATSRGPMLAVTSASSTESRTFLRVASEPCAATIAATRSRPRFSIAGVTGSSMPSDSWIGAMAASGPRNRSAGPAATKLIREGSNHFLVAAATWDFVTAWIRAGKSASTSNPRPSVASEHHWSASPSNVSKRIAKPARTADLSAASSVSLGAAPRREVKASLSFRATIAAESRRAVADSHRNPPLRSADCPTRTPPRPAAACTASWLARAIGSSSGSPAGGPGTPTHTSQRVASLRWTSDMLRAGASGGAARAGCDARALHAPNASATSDHTLSGCTSPTMARTAPDGPQREL